MATIRSIVFSPIVCLILLSLGILVNANKGKRLSLWGEFDGKLVYEGCFEINAQSTESRTDSQNNNFFCSAFCKDEGKAYSATIRDKCLCLDNLPSHRLAQYKCDSRCPDLDYDEGGSCGGFGCCGSQNNNAISVYKSQGRSRDQLSSKRSAGSSVLDVQGCFDDTQNGIVAQSSGRSRTDSANTALRCAEFCSGKGFSVASLREDLCACTNDLPLNRLYEGSDGTRECNMRCAGVFPSPSHCKREECCGGGSDDIPVYSVIVVGDVDVLKQLMSRIYSNIRSDPAVHVLKDAFGESICEQHWQYFRGSCVRYYETGKSYTDAKKHCEDQGARLLTLRHKEDIKAFPLANQQTTFFIGLEHNKATNTWLWQTGEPVTYYVKQATNVKDASQSCGVYVFGGYIYSHKSDGFCNFKWAYVCQRFVQVSAVAEKRKSGSKGMTKYTMDMATPDAIKESLPKSDDSVLSLSLENMREKIKKENSQSSEHLAGYDVTMPNKDGSDDAKLHYTHEVSTSESTEVTISGGMSYTIGVGTEFETSYFGLAEHKITAEFSTTGSWEKGTTTTSVASLTHTYTFTFPVPKGCDATVMMLKEKIPTRIDWKAEFYISGKLELTIKDVTKAIDISRIAKASDRYVYGFGNSKYGSRPTIVPKYTLDCVGKEKEQHVMTNKRVPVKGKKGSSAKPQYQYSSRKRKRSF